jgi:signal transduction histidine kinase/PAS domain-containing protein
MYCRLIHSLSTYWRSPHPAHLPTFRPYGIGIALVTLGLILWQGANPLLLLSPLVIGAVLLPAAWPILGIAGVWAIALMLLIIPANNIPNGISTLGTLGIITLASLLSRSSALQQEWKLAAQALLANLSDPRHPSPRHSITVALDHLRTLAQADTVLLLQQLDPVTAEIVISQPTPLFPNPYTTTTLLTEALTQQCCKYYTDPDQIATLAPLLAAKGGHTVAVLPLHYPERVAGGVLLVWRSPIQLSPLLKLFLADLPGGLSTFLAFQDMARQAETLQARLVAMLQTLPQGIVFVDENGAQGWVNATAAAHLQLSEGLTSPQVIAQAMTALRQRAENYADLTVQAIQYFSNPAVEIRDWQWRFTHPPQVLSLSSTPVQQHDAPGRLWVIDDITERKRAQEERERQTRRAQLFAEVTLKIRQSLNLQDIVQAAVTEVQAILNADRVLVYRLRPDKLGTGVAEALHTGIASAIAAPATDLPADYGKMPFPDGIQFLTHRDHLHSFSPTHQAFIQTYQVQTELVVPIDTTAGRWGFLIAHQCDRLQTAAPTAADPSEHRPRDWTPFETELLIQLAAQLGIALTQAQLLEQETQQRQELTRSNTELQQFAYVASHDLQEPLRMITSYLQLLEKRYKSKLDTDAEEFIAFAVDGATRMKRLIADLLSYSRVGTHSHVPQLTDCSQVVQHALRNLKVAIAESDAMIICENLPQVMADPDQLVQVFQNLLSNAMKFRTDQPPQIYINATLQGQEWCFSVRDNGIGLDPEYADRIFVIFQRLHGRSQYSGTGIGLAICKKIVERHGGKIWVQSAPHQGSTFYFTIPSAGDSSHD